MQRRLPIGAEVQEEGVHFRVWAPESRSVSVEILSDSSESKPVRLEKEAGGYFAGLVKEAKAGTRYKYKLDSGSYPDPASRFQPEGPHGPSQVIDPSAYQWRDSAWKGLPAEDLVIYEMHLGTFTREGTWRAAAEQIPQLKRLGITLIEVMPIAEFCGRFGWGYDGVDLFAPTRLYGSPDDARAFVDAAHQAGIMVILDVVYNHFGPDGNYLAQFSKDYFSSTYKCEWGEALNFDGANSKPAREFFVANAQYWIEEFHFDGLRLDATQQIFDKSETYILAEVSEAVRKAAPGRSTFLVGENEPQNTRMVRDLKSAGYGLDALWNDDYHHTARVAATGRREAYYFDYKGSPQEFISAAKYGYLFQGQFYSWQQQRRGTPAFGLSPKNFVCFLQNHDQVANSLNGARLHQQTSPPLLRALTALTLLGPWIPMLFQGDEFAATTPFLYFADHNPELNKMVSKGRGEFLRQFRSIAAEECSSLLLEPSDVSTFEKSKLDFADRERNRHILKLHEDLLRIRRTNKVLRSPKGLDGAVLGDRSFVLRYFSGGDDDRLLIVNLGNELNLNPSPEPLLAPHLGKGWRTEWSSEHPDYGGSGTPSLETTANWILPALSAVLMISDEKGKLTAVKLNQAN